MDSLRIEAKERGGHAAWRHKTVDTTLATSVIVMAPQLVVSRKTNPQQPPVVSIPAFHTAYAAAAAPAVADAVDTETPRTTGAEDFAHMPRACPSAYIPFGNGPVARLHHPKYDFNDLNVPAACSRWVELAQQRLTS